MSREVSADIVHDRCALSLACRGACGRCDDRPCMTIRSPGPSVPFGEFSPSQGLRARGRSTFCGFSEPAWACHIPDPRTDGSGM